jgi:hypothetical protein
MYKHDPSISIKIGHGDSSWNVSQLLRAEKNAAFLPGSRDLNRTGKWLTSTRVRVKVKVKFTL